MGILSALRRVANPIRAFHGSPHEFDRFTLNQIGEGAGVQSYGHGLYFADNPIEASRFKKNRHVPVNQQTEGLLYEVNLHATPDEILDLNNTWSSLPDDARAKLGGVNPFAPYIVDNPKSRIVVVPSQMKDESRQFIETRPLFGKKGFYKYENGARRKERYDTADDVMQAYHYDPQVLDVVNAFSSNPKEAAEMLKQKGFVASKYSYEKPKAGVPSKTNYVVFDDNIIEILKRYGLIPAATLGGGLLSQLQSNRANETVNA